MEICRIGTLSSLATRPVRPAFCINGKGRSFLALGLVDSRIGGGRDDQVGFAARIAGSIVAGSPRSSVGRPRRNQLDILTVSRPFDQGLDDLPARPVTTKRLRSLICWQPFSTGRAGCRHSPCAAVPTTSGFRDTLHGLFDAGVEILLSLQPSSVSSLVASMCIAHASWPGAVGDVLDQLVMRCASRMQLVHQGANTGDDIDIAALIAAADIIGFADPAGARRAIQGTVQSST